MGKHNKGSPARRYKTNGKKDANVKPKQIDDSGMESGKESDMETDTVAPTERQVKSYHQHWVLFIIVLQ